MEKFDIDFYRSMMRTAMSAGLPVISVDTAARILAAVCVLGNNEALTFSPKLKVDLEYIQNRFGIYGGGHVDTHIAVLVRQYIEELENYKSSTPYTGTAVFHQDRPQWVDELFEQRYGIKLIN